jgi:multidrug efflux pump subunit AcrA (membrane-fusion protein)
VAAGTPLADLVSVDRLWIRVPLYAGDARTVARGEPAYVTALGQGGVRLTATPVRGPPKADAAAASIDIYYEVRGGGLRPGERVNVAVPLAAAGSSLSSVALSAVVYDAQGGTWVYERLDSLSFARRRVDIDRVAGDRAVLARGPKVGTRVVTAGVVELFGTEFGSGK